jgi:hypothetical protein
MEDANSIPCSLLDLDGRPISQALATFANERDSGEFIVSKYDRPGSVVRHCLTDGVREVLVRLGEEAPQPATVKRTYFDIRNGRVCLVQLQNRRRNDQGQMD